MIVRHIKKLRFLSLVKPLAMSFIILISLTAITGQKALGQAPADTHTVKNGETLFSIAQQHEVEVSDIREWNNLSNNQIETGQKLIIRREAETDRAGFIEHRVKPDETLYSIAREYGVTVSAIQNWNRLNNEQINPGQLLHIKESAISSDQANAETSKQKKSQPPSPRDEKNSAESYYVVKSGDNLFEIAKKHDMSVEKLKSLNDLTSNSLRIGQRLLVRKPTPVPSVTKGDGGEAPQGKFITYEVGKGEDWKMILRKFKMDSVELAAMNPEVEYGEVNEGEQLTVLLPPTSNYKNPYRFDAQMKSIGRISVTKYPDTARGSTTTSGELYNPEALTAAHPSIALGSILFIQNPHNKRGIYVRVNDRTSGQEMKLSHKAFEALHFSSTKPIIKLFQQK